jgi:hypothetical protein
MQNVANHPAGLSAGRSISGSSKAVTPTGTPVHRSVASDKCRKLVMKIICAHHTATAAMRRSGSPDVQQITPIESQAKVVPIAMKT